MTSDTSALPRVIATSVIRSSRQGDSHGGVYLVDLESGSVEQVLDWDVPDIRWEGRGGDRGLRGVAFHEGRIYMAASDEIFVFDRDFSIVGSFRNRYLRHCHEISRRGERLFLTSTGFDAVLELDLATGEFVRGHALRYRRLGRAVHRRIRWRRLPGRRRFVEVRGFDPRDSDGPPERDTVHVNNVVAGDGRLWVSGQRMDLLLGIEGERVAEAIPIPYGTHNATPRSGAVLFNHTANDALVAFDRKGRVALSAAMPAYDPDRIRDSGVPEDHARAGFGRGLCFHGDRIAIAGSSPATVTAYDLVDGSVLASVNVSMDVRNAIHGLEIWPFD